MAFHGAIEELPHLTKSSSEADDFIRRTFSKGKGEKYGESYICRKAERGFK